MTTRDNIAIYIAQRLGKVIADLVEANNYRKPSNWHEIKVKLCIYFIIYFFIYFIFIGVLRKSEDISVMCI